MTAPGEPLPATYGEHLMSVDSSRPFQPFFNPDRHS